MFANTVELAAPQLGQSAVERRADTDMHRDVTMVQVEEFETGCKSSQLAS